MNFYDFTIYKKSNRSYAGNSGLKLGVLINEENWFLKFPKNMAGMRNVDISYTTAPLSEYIGSQIFKSIGIETHETLLGSYGDKVVVACKDFRQPTEELVEFRALKNDYVVGLEEKIASSSSENKTQMSTLLLIMNENPTFIEMPNLKSRFWDMFVVDAFIGNNDRNSGNWGILVNHLNNSKRLAPVYDNGASFSGKLSENQIIKIMSDDDRFVQSVYTSRTCAFTDDNDRLINPLKYIESTNNKDCLSAVSRVVKNIEIDKLNQIIDDIPEKVGKLFVMSDTKKKFYKMCLKYRYDNILLPIYNTI